MIQLQRVTGEQEPILYALLQKYLYEMSGVYVDLQETDGNYDYPWLKYYFTEPERAAYFICLDDRRIGFALINRHSHTGEEIDSSLAEFTIFPGYRRHGYAMKAVEALVNARPGRWQLKYSTANTAGSALWTQVTEKYNGKVTNLEGDEVVVTFETKGIPVQLKKLPEIAVIGKEGLCTAENNVVSELWAESNAHFGEVASLGMREKDGSYVGFWGAMSDVSRQFKPWEDGFSRGLYLAGIEVNHDAEAPQGWTKWVLPARTWLIADVVPGKYGEIFHEVLSSVIPGMGLELCGAVCDYTEPSTGKNKLFFPVTEKI